MKSLILTVLLFAMPVMAGFTVPAVNNPVNDYSNVLSASGKEAIAEQIVKLKQDTKAQLGVLIVDTLDGDSLEESSMKVATAWRLGSKIESDGVLLFVVIKDRKMRIEVGQGLEGTLTDARSKQILGSMKSYLRSGNYDGAIKAGVEGISSTVRSGKAESTPAPTSQEDGNGVLYFILSAVGLGGAVVFFMCRADKKRQREEEEAEARWRKSMADSRLEDSKLTGRRYETPVASRSTSKKSSRSTVGVAPVVAPVIVDDYRSRRSSSYDSGSSSSSSDSGSSYGSSDWGGGGGDFSGGGSSDSW